MENQKNLNLHCRPVKKSEDPDDEEITSESDSEETHEMTGNVKETKTAIKRKLTTEEIPEFLAKRHKDLHSYRSEYCSNSLPITVSCINVKQKSICEWSAS